MYIAIRRSNTYLTAMENYLCSTHYLNSEHPDIIALADSVRAAVGDDAIAQAIHLYYRVRDEIRYDPYNIDLQKENMRADVVWARKSGYCIEKGWVMAATARALGIPSALGFANVRNHLSTQKFIDLLRSDVFAFHGYVCLYLEGKWVKCTPVFNQTLCERMGVSPLEFNGREDSIFHEYESESKSKSGYMEYLKFHGEFDDMPYDLFVAELKAQYPHFFNGEVVDDIVSH